MSEFQQKGFLEASLVPECWKSAASSALAGGSLSAVTNEAVVRFDWFFFRRLPLISITMKITFVFF